MALNQPPLQDQWNAKTPGVAQTSWALWFQNVWQLLTGVNSVTSNTGVTSDATLQVGQSVYIDVTGATSVPLHVAVSDGQMYELTLSGSFTPAVAGTVTYLQINNTNFLNGFTYRAIYAAGAVATAATATSTDSGFRLEMGGASVFSSTTRLFTATVAKRAITNSGSATNTVSYASTIEGEWQDTTTAWTSLGTVILPVAWTGRARVRRIG